MPTANESKCDFKKITSLWKDYCKISNEFTAAMGDGTNEVGVFAEILVGKHYNAERLPPSHKSADLLCKDGTTIQVKARKMKQLKPTRLSIIRSWEFDILVVVLFKTDGDMHKAIAIDSERAKEIAKLNEHQHGDVLVTSSGLLEHRNATDITNELRRIMRCT